MTLARALEELVVQHVSEQSIHLRPVGWLFDNDYVAGMYRMSALNEPDRSCSMISVNIEWGHDGFD